MIVEPLRTAARHLAEKTSRRQFLRTASNTAFLAVAIRATGRVAKSMTNLTKCCESIVGAGCPCGCGPSPACNASGRSSSCKCGTGGNCTNNGVDCHGSCGQFGVDWPNSGACWTCIYVCCLPGGNGQFTNTCCDCATSGCGDAGYGICGGYGICISYKSTLVFIGPCGATPEVVPAGTTAYIDTGDPATSWVNPDVPSWTYEIPASCNCPTGNC